MEFIFQDFTESFFFFWKAKLILTCRFIPLEEGFCWALILSLGLHSQFHSRRLWENKIYHECCYSSSLTHSVARSLARWSSLSSRLDNNTNIFLCSKPLKVCHLSSEVYLYNICVSLHTVVDGRSDWLKDESSGKVWYQIIFFQTLENNY